MAYNNVNQYLIVKQTAGKCAVELVRNTEITPDNYEEVMAIVKRATNDLFQDFIDVPVEPASAGAPQQQYSKPSYGGGGGGGAPKQASPKQLKFVKDLLTSSKDFDYNRKQEIESAIGGECSAKQASDFIDELQK